MATQLATQRVNQITRILNNIPFLAEMVQEGKITRGQVGAMIAGHHYNRFSYEGLCQAIRDGRLDWRTVYNPENPEASMPLSMVGIINRIYSVSACRTSIAERKFAISDILALEASKQSYLLRLCYTPRFVFTLSMVQQVLGDRFNNNPSQNSQASAAVHVATI